MLVGGLIAASLLAVPDSSGARESLNPARFRLTRLIPAGEEHIFGISVSPASGLAAAGRRDGRVQVWNARGWAPVRSFQAHLGYCYAAVFNPDGAWIATGGLDGAVKVWDSATGALLRLLRGGGEAVTLLAFASRDRLVSVGAEGAQVWDVTRGLPVWTLRAREVISLAAQGHRAATGALDGSVKIWDLEEGKEQKTVAAHGGCVHALAFHPHLRLLVSAGSDATLVIWDLKTGEAVRRIVGHKGPVHGLAFASAGRHLVSAGKDGARVWEFPEGREACGLSMDRIPAFGVALGAGGGEIVTAGGDNRIWVWAPCGPAWDGPEEADREGGFLGVSYADGGGVFINAVLEGTQAEKAGFRANDLIVGVNDRTIDRSEDFMDFMRQSREGDDMYVRVRRNGDARLIKVKLGRWK